jgi:hypothetical protein
MEAKTPSIKITFYMTGSFAKILRRCVEFLDWEITAICPNEQSYVESRKESRLSDIDYLYDGFNDVFDGVDVAQFCETYSSINLGEVLFVDKVHFKKKTGEYQLRYLCAMGEQIARVYRKSKPNYVLFPIIETIDAMLAYRMAEHFGIKPIVYAHARFTDRSYFSHSHLELLPEYAPTIERLSSNAVLAERFLDGYRASPGPFRTNPSVPSEDSSYDRDEDLGAFGRLLRNIRLKAGVEKHNQMINLWINFQVRFQTIFLPIRSWAFYLKEKFYIRPEVAPVSNYDFFPLHFSPESSINVPAPFYIDQIRVVDKILLERQGNRKLVVKEHPAMFGFRPRGFFRSLKKRPFVTIVPRFTSNIQLIRNATTVYSVTGTACVEAFFLGVSWIQYGSNFLSDWVERRRARSEVVSPSEFVQDVLNVSGQFVLYSPGRSIPLDKLLFSRSNLERLCAHLKFHVGQLETVQNAASSMQVEQ